MKLFLKTIRKENPIIKLINVKTFSDFALGVKVTKDGVIVEDDLQLFAPDGTEITPMETTYGDFVAFQLTAGDGPHQDIYVVKAGADSYPITIDIEEGTVADIGSASGGGGDFVPVEDTEESIPRLIKTTFSYTKDDGEIELDIDTTRNVDTEYEYTTQTYFTNDYIGAVRDNADSSYQDSWVEPDGFFGDFASSDSTVTVNASLQDGFLHTNFIEAEDTFLESKMKDASVYVANKTANEETRDESELTPTGLEVRHVDESEVVHTGELKHDGVYVDDNGFKPMTLSGVTEDDLSVTFKILGYEVQ